MLGGKLDKDDISLLSQTIANPSEPNIKMLFGNFLNLPKVNPESGESFFTPANFQNQLNNQESPLFKYLNSIIISFTSKEQEKEKLLLLQILEAQKKEVIADQISLEEKEAHTTEEKERVTSEQEQNISNTQNKLRQLDQQIYLNKSKAKELDHWMTVFGGNMTDLEGARNLIENRYDRINRNLNRFDELLSSADLNTTEKIQARENLKEYHDIYQRHIELSSIDNLEKHVPEYANKDVDAETGMQFLRKNAMHEELFEKYIDKIIAAPTVSDSSQTIEDPNVKHYQQLSIGLNNSVEKFFNRHEASNPNVPFNLSEPFNKVIKLLDSLDDLKNNPDRSKRENIDDQVADTIKTLNNDADYKEITDYLQKWQTAKNMPNWTKYAPPLTFNQNVDPKNKSNYLNFLSNVFGDKYLHETKTGYKFVKNDHQIDFDLKKNEITLNRFDNKLFEQIAKVIAQTAPPGTISHIDLSRVPEKNQMAAARIAQEQGLEVGGLSDENQARLSAQNVRLR